MGKIKKYKFSLLSFVVALLVVGSFLFRTYFNSGTEAEQKYSDKWWEVQSIDTVKYSRDLAREKKNDAQFNGIIDEQVEAIANIGATHIAIGTPYDDEFLPFLELWVGSARKYDLSVWFRGNFSGWEGWFGYGPIGPEEHIKGTEKFIHSNSYLFRDGDIFTSCPECENGQLGDPRYDIGVNEYRNFLVQEYEITKAAFDSIGKDVSSNYNSMNGDVARLVMDKQTTMALGGVVVVDHYVKEPEQLVVDIRALERSSGGRVLLGEFGVPVPDIHGSMAEEQQALWVSKALFELSKVESLIGVNYWTGFGGSTQLWNSTGPRKVVEEVGNYYSPEIITGEVVNELGKPIRNAEIIAGIKQERSDKDGQFNMLIVPSVEYIEIKARGYKNKQVDIQELVDLTKIVLEKEKEGIIFKLQRLFL